jgi:hypothetical protein
VTGTMTWAAMDVHARSTYAASLDVLTGELTRRRFDTGAVEPVVQWLAGLPAPVRACYEAGPTGFGLYRAAAGAGIDCQVIAPSKTRHPSRTSATKAQGRGCGRLALLHIPLESGAERSLQRLLPTFSALRSRGERNTPEEEGDGSDELRTKRSIPRAEALSTHQRWVPPLLGHIAEAPQSGHRHSRCVAPSYRRDRPLAQRPRAYNHAYNRAYNHADHIHDAQRHEHQPEHPCNVVVSRDRPARIVGSGFRQRPEW